MARRITVLEKTFENEAVLTFHYALWLVPPVARQSYYATGAGWQSNVPDVSTTELADLRAGRLYEMVDTGTFLKPLTQAQLGQQFIDLYTSQQAALNADNRYLYYGTYYDDVSGWQVKGAP